MSVVVEYNHMGKPTVKKHETLCAFLNGSLPSRNQSYSALITSIDAEILAQHKVTQGALNNVHGDWYEVLLAAEAKNYFISKNLNYEIVLLPNAAQYDIFKLYKNDLGFYIDDLRLKLAEHSDVSLITSNPDFVVIDTTNLLNNLKKTTSISKLTIDEVDTLANRYENFEGICDLNDIVGYFSVKTSLRPDRRLQLPHEGSLMKALYVHMQTRDWIINPKGLKYWAAAQSVSPADIKGLRTVATHSITNVQGDPEKAVDNIFQINSPDEAIAAFSEMISSI